jgi:hypothetical protein
VQVDADVYLLQPGKSKPANNLMQLLNRAASTAHAAADGVLTMLPTVQRFFGGFGMVPTSAPWILPPSGV